MQQPKMRILATNDILPVWALFWLDWWNTLRAYPIEPDYEWRVTNYVIVKWERETTEVWAELIFED